MLEVWLRGPLVGIPPMLQPVAHALLQASEEIEALVCELPEELIWERPGNVASVAFHLQHIPGVLDRLMTYANGNQLSAAQLQLLKAEGIYDPDLRKAELLEAVRSRIDATIEALKQIDEATLTQQRFVGRQQLPSTKIGLIFHAAEHTMRHTGQLHVTVKVLLNKL